MVMSKFSEIKDNINFNIKNYTMLALLSSKTGRIGRWPLWIIDLIVILFIVTMVYFVDNWLFRVLAIISLITYSKGLIIDYKNYKGGGLNG